MYSKLAKVADDAQYVDGDLRWNNDYIMNTVLPPIIEKYNYLFEDKKQLKEAYERFITMFKSKYAHDFYFIKKQETVNKLDETKKAL
jgi:hypothetical protein